MVKVEISFILGIRNAERTLEECLESILIQDYPKAKYEIIIVDGNSTDSTLKIVKKFMGKNKNIRLFNNPYKLSEGKGMSKDIGVQKARGEIVIFLDHDNIILDKSWLKNILEPFENKKIMASQSLLQFKEGDSNFLKYVNALGVEDPFAVPYSLVSQVVLNPDKFDIEKGAYYVHELNENWVLFGGANGCALRKKVFSITGNYTRDVDVFARMALRKMKVAVPIKGRIYHATSSNFLNFMHKKGIYFYRFINKEYKEKSFKWVPYGKRGKLKFALMIFYNLSLIGPGYLAYRQVVRTERFFWILHPFLLFYMTLMYGIITLFKLRNFFEYA